MCGHSALTLTLPCCFPALRGGHSSWPECAWGRFLRGNPVLYISWLPLVEYLKAKGRGRQAQEEVGRPRTARCTALEASQTEACCSSSNTGKAWSPGRGLGWDREAGSVLWVSWELLPCIIWQGREKESFQESFSSGRSQPKPSLELPGTPAWVTPMSPMKALAEGTLPLLDGWAWVMDCQPAGPARCVAHLGL